MQARPLARSVLDIACALAIIAVALGGIAGARLRAEHGPWAALTAGGLALCTSPALDDGTLPEGDDPSRLGHCDDCPAGLAMGLEPARPQTQAPQLPTGERLRSHVLRAAGVDHGSGWPRAPPAHA